MTETRNRTWEEVRDELHANDPELAKEYQALEPAYLVAQALIAARSELGLSQSDVARAMETSPSVVSRIESMEGGAPTMRTVVAIARALGRSVELRFVDRAADADAGESVPALQAWQDTLARITEAVRGRLSEISEEMSADLAKLDEVGHQMGRDLGEALHRAVLVAAQKGRTAAKSSSRKSAVG